jgi:predicted DNA-binding protein
MSASTLSFRASPEFAAQTRSLASLFNMPSSEYLREAVREKNERVLKDRMTYLSKQLSGKHLLENEAMDATTGDGLD